MPLINDLVLRKFLKYNYDLSIIISEGALGQ